MWELSFGNGRPRTFVWELQFGHFRLDTFAEERCFGNVRLICFAWKLWFGTVRLEVSVLERSISFRLLIPKWSLFARELSCGIFETGSNYEPFSKLSKNLFLDRPS